MSCLYTALCSELNVFSKSTSWVSSLATHMVRRTSSLVYAGDNNRAALWTEEVPRYTPPLRTVNGFFCYI